MVADADVGSVAATGRLDDIAVGGPAVAALVVRCADDGVTAAADADVAGCVGDDMTRREAGGTRPVVREVDDDGLADVMAGAEVGAATAGREPEEEVGGRILNFF